MISKRIIQSVNPATKEVIGEIPCMGKADIDLAIIQASETYLSWRVKSFKQRAKYFHSLSKVISDHADELAALITREVGKPLVESLTSELSGPLEACEWFASNTERALKDQMIALTNPILFSKQSIISFEPLGVIGIISPWNYPFAIPMMSIIMALITGNTVVLKPSEKSTLIGLKIGELFSQAGFPHGCVNVIAGDCETGELLTQNNKLSKIIFTGSVEGGIKVMTQAARNLTPVTLELGGKDAALILPDAPIEWTARGLVWGAFTNCGQACASIERAIIIAGPRNQKLIEAIVETTRSLNLGAGNNPNNDIGPLIDQAQLDKVASQVEQAVSAGATVLCGGKRREDLGGFFYEPTVLTNVNESMDIMRQETFGPVLPIMLVDSEDEAIKLANRCEYGLGASIWTHDLRNAEDIATDLEVGVVTINDGLFSFACPQLPWGGLKKSGTGRTHSYFGLLDLVNIKLISIDYAGGGHRQWWFPYNSRKMYGARGGLDFLHSKSILKKVSGLLAFAHNSIFKPKK